ncbi:MAG: hypothetical protein JWR85_241 [Marmoricola sp.]|nr:hypothetical protein [Marmoricola sp.]
MSPTHSDAARRTALRARSVLCLFAMLAALTACSDLGGTGEVQQPEPASKVEPQIDEPAGTQSTSSEPTKPQSGNSQPGKTEAGSSQPRKPKPGGAKTRHGQDENEPDENEADSREKNADEPDENENERGDSRGNEPDENEGGGNEP